MKMSEKKSKSIFRVLLIPLLSVLLLQLLFMIGTFFFSGVFGRLDENMKDILQKQVENRKDYLLNEMIGNWSDLDSLSEDIRRCVQEKLENGEVSLDGLCSKKEEYTAVLNEVIPYMIDTMYHKQVSGVFLILDTLHPEQQGADTILPGIYLRDLDPRGAPSANKEDILVERAPRDVVQAGVLSTDVDWQPMFFAEDSLQKAYFYKPYREAYEKEAMEGRNADAYGYWTSESYCLSGNHQSAIAYSVPLILEDGTVYGVVGIELLVDYIESLLPFQELHKNEIGSYLLAVAKDGTDVLEPVVLTGNTLHMEEVLQNPFVLCEDNSTAEENSGAYYAAAEALTIYSRNAPFEGEKWYLLGCVPKKHLFEFSEQLRWSFLLTVIVTLTAGFFGVLLVSIRISRPVKKLSEEVERSQHTRNKMPELSEVHILEIDRLVDAVARLGREVLESSARFLSIINMASVELAGYELREDTSDVYVTGNYFELLGMKEVETEKLTVDEFIRLQEKLKQTLEYTVAEDGSVLYAVPLENEEIRYLRAEEQKLENRRIGLMEDVTSSVLETKKIERDRDYDVLTGLLSRQGFQREAERVFRKEEILKTAAVLMIDLDNLKIMNDTFGHNVGDLYIQKASACFREHVPARTLCARISGDEFMLLFYGYEDHEEIWKHVMYLYQKIRTMDFVLPDGTNKGVSASGGLAWYPRDSKKLSDLMKFSDFAMYCVKKQEKGNVGDFDLLAYQAMQRRNQMQQEFYQILEQKQIQYHFQPIFDARTGKPYAYEALMRVSMPNLRSPLDVLQIARETDRMREVETITIFNATEAYEKLRKENLVEEGALLFVNSMADVSMSEENNQKYHQRFASLQEKIVVEITETENLDMELIQKKKSVEGFSGEFALDDYGSGYNTELNLLGLNPKYVKVDIAITSNIHQDEDKQQIVRNIVEYAHKRGMLIIAEGLEYREELEKTLELGVDLLQGYFLAKPGAVPPEISKEAHAIIRAYWEKQDRE